MKKTFFAAVAMIFAFSFAAKAQTNFQVFYDFGDDRNNVTTTLEGYYGDNWGDTYFFIDYDFNTKKNGVPGSYGSYFEIARGLNFWKDSAVKDLSAHVELNAGVNFGNINWLFGANYLLHNEDYSNTLTLELMFKTFKGSSSDLPMQFTAVWGMQDIFDVKGLRFCGFFDIWGENGYLGSRGDKFVFLSEPQLWYNVGQHFGCDNLNLGGEVEISCNFAGVHGWKVRPCLGAKWVF